MRWLLESGKTIKIFFMVLFPFREGCGGEEVFPSCDPSWDDVGGSDFVRLY
jgi:hypothetical protein